MEIFPTERWRCPEVALMLAAATDTGPGCGPSRLFDHHCRRHLQDDQTRRQTDRYTGLRRSCSSPLSAADEGLGDRTQPLLPAVPGRAELAALTPQVWEIPPSPPSRW